MKKMALICIILGVILLAFGAFEFFLSQRNQEVFDKNKEDLEGYEDSSDGKSAQETLDTQKNMFMAGAGGGAVFLIIGIALAAMSADQAGGSVDKNILYVIRAMTVLLGAGVGLESSMEHVANSNYGDISVMFKKVLDESKRGEYIEDALQREANLTTSTAMRRVLNTMVLGSKGEIDLVEALSKIAEREMKQREQQIDNFIETLGTRAEIYMTMGILVPIIIVVVIFVAILIKETGGALGGGGGMDAMTQPPVIAGLLFGDLAVLGAIAIKTKLDEPQI